MAHKVAEGDGKGERDDPQKSEPNIEKQDAPEIMIDAPMETEHFKIHSAVRAG